jgi:hypothetical protein
MRSLLTERAALQAVKISSVPLNAPNPGCPRPRSYESAIFSLPFPVCLTSENRASSDYGFEPK